MPPKKRQTAARVGATASLDPSKLKVAQLKNELEKRGLDSSGKKADLVSRLEDALSGIFIAKDIGKKLSEDIGMILSFM